MSTKYADCRKELLQAMYIANERFERGQRDAQLKTQYEREVKQLEVDISDLRATANHMRDIYSNIKSYSIKHSERARNILDLAILEAGELVPDANTSGIHLNQTEGNRVTVVNGRGQNINVREGCGYRAILGALLRYACLKAQPDAFPLMLYDEYFFTLSDITTSVIKDVFLALKRDVALICIEQRRNAMCGIVDKEYTFKKGRDGITEVKCTYEATQS